MFILKLFKIQTFECTCYNTIQYLSDINKNCGNFIVYMVKDCKSLMSVVLDERQVVMIC